MRRKKNNNNKIIYNNTDCVAPKQKANEKLKRNEKCDSFSLFHCYNLAIAVLK